MGKNNENFKSVLVEGYGYEGQWSKTGDRLLYSVHNGNSDFKPQVWIVNAQGNAAGSGRRNLKLETWAHKCGFGENNVAYCAVPREMREGIGFAPELASGVADNFYRIDLNTGVKTQIAQPDGNYTAQKVFVSEDGKFLYFRDQNSGNIHKIEL